MTRRAVRLGWLVALWVLLWGDLSVANVAGGVVVGVALLVAYPTRPRVPSDRGRVHPFAVIRLAVHVVVRFVMSNASVAREIVTPGSGIRTGIVACPMRSRSSALVSFVSNVLALSPGIMPVDIEIERWTLFVHVLHMRDPERTRREVATLEALAIRAFGSPTDRAALVAVEVAR